ENIVRLYIYNYIQVAVLAAPHPRIAFANQPYPRAAVYSCRNFDRSFASLAHTSAAVALAARRTHCTAFATAPAAGRSRLKGPQKSVLCMSDYTRPTTSWASLYFAPRLSAIATTYVAGFTTSK